MYCQCRRNPDEHNTTYRPLYSGLWAEELKNQDIIPVGGSLLTGELDTLMVMDFDNLGLTKRTPEEARQNLAYYSRRAGLSYDKQVIIISEILLRN
jgi:hypothetical protein